MSDLRSDMFRLGRIYPVTINFAERKSRLGSETMCTSPDKLTISKLDNMDLKVITGITRSNLHSWIKI
jgi:hypothetical protein